MWSVMFCLDFQTHLLEGCDYSFQLLFVAPYGSSFMTTEFNYKFYLVLVLCLDLSTTLILCKQFWLALTLIF